MRRQNSGFPRLDSIGNNRATGQAAFNHAAAWNDMRAKPCFAEMHSDGSARMKRIAIPSHVFLQ
jgi:hypothetical protein